MSHPQTLETREKIRHGLHRYHLRKRQLAEVKPRDLARLERTGVVARALRPLIAIATEEAEGLTIALGGPDRVTPQQRILIEDLCATGIALRACTALFLKEPDPDIASKIGTLTGARRSSLALLGLERHELDVPSLSEYLQAKSASQDPAEATNADTPDESPAAVSVRAAAVDGGDVPAGAGEVPLAALAVASNSTTNQEK